jgi:predicted RNA-binding Zn ribbon-like protein
MPVAQAVLTEYEQYNPLRQPDWRHTKALDLVERAWSRREESQRNYRRYTPAFRTHDKHVLAVARFEYAIRDAGDNLLARERLFSKSRAAYYAWQLSQDETAGSFGQRMRYVVEARLLAGEDDETIAKRLQTLPETIAWYEKTYFNIRDRMSARDWIVQHIFCRSAVAGIEGQPYDFTPKLFAYFGGPLALDGILYQLETGNRIGQADQYQDYFDRQVERVLRSRTAVESLRLEVNRYNNMELLNVYCRLREVERQHYEGHGGAKTTLETAVNDMLESLPWSVGGGERRDSYPQDEYADSAVELRADEERLVATGKAPEYVRNLKNFTLPFPSGTDGVVHESTE